MFSPDQVIVHPSPRLMTRLFWIRTEGTQASVCRGETSDQICVVRFSGLYLSSIQKCSPVWKSLDIYWDLMSVIGIVVKIILLARYVLPFGWCQCGRRLPEINVRLNFCFPQ